MFNEKSIGTFLRRKKTLKQDGNWSIILRWFYARWKLMTSKIWFIIVCLLFITFLILFHHPSLWMMISVDDTTGHSGLTDVSTNSPSRKNVVGMQATAHAIEVAGEDGDEKNKEINPHDYAYVINEEETCSSYWKFGGRGHEGGIVGGRVGGPFLLIFVLSNLRNFERRLAIRQSWGNRQTLMQHNVRLLFLTGVSEDGQEKQQQQQYQRRLQEESSKFRDIVQENFIDSYLNLTLKSVMGLKWMTNYCPMAEYVMKTDDDIYVNVDLLSDFLRETLRGRRRRWIGGCIKQIKSPLPFNKHGERVEALTIGHPPFAAGAGYVMSGDLVPLLYAASLRRRLVPVEDAFVTAYCALMVGVTPEHDDRFNCGEPVNNDCQMAFKFVGHHVTADMQLRIFNVLNGKGNVCKILN